MFGKDFQRRYALSDQGIKNTKKGTFWTVITNLIVMGGMGILTYMMNSYMNTLTDGAPLPNAVTILALVLVFLILITHHIVIRLLEYFHSLLCLFCHAVFPL